MDNQNKKEKTIGLKLIFGWTVGLAFFLLGAGNLFKVPIMGIFEICAAMIVFPPFMQFVKDRTGIKLSGVLRLVIFLMLIGIGVSLSLSKADDVKTTQTKVDINQVTTAPTPTPIIINISEFIDEYGKNKVSVQNRYTNKLIQFTGYVKNISSDIVGQYYLELAPTNDQYYWGVTIRCYFVDKDKLVNFSKGQSVIVAGVLQDTSYETWVELHDCSSSK